MNIKKTDLNPIYAEVADIVGIENTVKIYDDLHGQQIVFPQRLFSQRYVIEYVQKNYNGSNIRELSRKFGYSERRIRQFIKCNIE